MGELARRVTDIAHARDEDHTYRTKLGHVLCVMPGARRHQFRRQAQFARRVGDQGANASVSRRGNIDVDLFEVELSLTCCRDPLRFSADSLVEHVDLRRVEVAKLKTEHDLTGYDIRRTRQRVDPADSAHLPPGHTRDDTIDSFNKLRRCKQCILPIVHRGRSRVIRETFDRHVPPVDPDNAFDDTDLDLLVIEMSTLFDVQFEIRSDVAFLATDFGELHRIAADKLDSLANGFAAATDEIEFAFGEFAIHRAAADQPTFFVLKDDDLEWMKQTDVLLRQCLRNFNRAHGADYSVVVSTVRNSVNMRSDQQRLETACASSPSSD